jgi:glycosyltransferase involved in cell wall biosynthesis
VIIPTRNSSKTIAICCESIKNQSYRNIEIIIVDNNSDDDTLEIARQYTNKIYKFSPERSSQINHGAENSSGHYIYRVDSDFVLEPDVVSEAVNAAESNNYAGVLIHNTSDPTISFWAKVRKFERDMYDANSLNIAVRFIRKDAFQSVGGLDERLVYGEDYDLHNRITEKFKIGKINAKEIHLGEYKTIKEIAKVNYYYGRTAPLFLKKNRSRGIKQVSPFRKVYLRNYKAFFKHPHLALGFIVYQIVRYSSGGIGLLVAIIGR